LISKPTAGATKYVKKFALRSGWFMMAGDRNLTLI
jgi:hypothetical protein